MRTPLLLATSFSTLLAGPPMLSDDPFPASYKQFEVYVASEYQYRESLISTLPLIDFNYGVAPDLQLTFETGYIESEYQNGFSSLSLELKYRFYSSDFFTIALLPAYASYPIASIFNEAEVYSFSLPMQFSLSENLALIVSPAYIIALDDRAHFEAGSYLQYSYQKSSFMLEYFVEESKFYEEDIFGIVNVGYTYQINSTMLFAISAGREIHARDASATIGYLGLQFVF